MNWPATKIASSYEPYLSLAGATTWQACSKAVEMSVCADSPRLPLSTHWVVMLRCQQQQCLQVTAGGNRQRRNIHRQTCTFFPLRPVASFTQLDSSLGFLQQWGIFTFLAPFPIRWGQDLNCPCICYDNPFCCTTWMKLWHFFNTYLHRESQIIQDIFHCECTILSGVFCVLWERYRDIEKASTNEI